MSKDVASNSVNNVLKEICENDEKAEIKYIDEAETSSKLDYENKVKTKDPSWSKYNMAIHERTFSGGVSDKDRSD